ncbi:MAG TPA: hypothetical protein VMT53_00155 [Terriglobales bacterium]|nr:hypothetical protein [Terriglobales bacterium]
MRARKRQRLVFLGAPLAIVPALAFLPALAYLVITPSVAHATLIAGFLFPLMALAEILGLFRLVVSCLTRPFDLLTMFAFSALLVILVIAAYTGFFLAVLAGRM